MKPKKKFSYAEQSQRLRVKKVSKDEDLFAKLCEIFGSSTLELQQTLAQNSNQSEEEVDIGLIDGIWKAVPVSVTPENEIDTKMDELPYSTESCVVEVPTIEDQYKELNNSSGWDIDSTFAEAESLASLDDTELLKSVSDIKDALSETQDISVKNMLSSCCISTSRKTSSVSTPPVNADVDGTVKSVNDIKKALIETQDFPFKNSPSKQSVVNSIKSSSVSSSRAATELIVSSEKCDDPVHCQTKDGSNIGKIVDKKMKRKVAVCLSNLEVKSLQDELALELKKAVQEFAKKRNNVITTKHLEKDSAVQSAISTIDNPEIMKSVYQSQYFVDVEKSDKSIFSRGCSERSSASSVELPLALMLSKPKVEDTTTDTKSNVYDSVYEASVTEYEPESPRDSLENFDFGDKAERNSISSSTDSGVPSSGGSKDSPVPDERQIVPISLTFYTNPALETGANSPILSEGTVNSGFEADRNCDEDTEETYKQIVIDVAEKGEKRIRFASSMESINSISTYNEAHEPKKQDSNYVISLALSAVRIWTQIKSYLAQSKTQVETVIENPEDEINDFTQPVITELNTKVAKPVRTGIQRIGSDLHVKYVQIARDRRWLPKARIHQETSDWLLDIPKGLNSFEELRKYVKDGGDMAKEISNILQERSDLDASYAKGLSKLAAKMMKVSRESSGTIAAAWQAVGSEMEAESELHKTLAVSLSEDLVKPFRHVIETQHRTRKAVEVTVDKTARSLAEWRAAQAKAKKQCYMCARDNEKMQDVGFGDSRHGRLRTLSEKETVKLGLKRRKSEEALRKADVEYYAYCVRAERARLDWEAATNRGSRCFQAMEEERLTQMRDVASQYLSVVKNLGPKLVQSADRLNIPIACCSIDSDLQTVVSLRSAGSNVSEQLLPDFYAEHMSNVMNRDRRKETLEKCLNLICGDIEREKRAKTGVENLSRALQENPNFGTDESQQEITDKLKHLRSMLAFLEATKVKVSNAVADIENKPKTESPFVKYLEVHKDKQGLIQSVLKLPSWAQDLDSEGESPTGSDSPDFIDEGTLDEGQPDSDFDEFSSPESDSEDYSHSAADSLSPKALKNTPPLQQEIVPSTRGNGGRCRALYTYTANMYDELTIHPGDIINIHDKQEDGWWVGELEGNIGIFPATYVEELKD